MTNITIKRSFTQPLDLVTKFALGKELELSNDQAQSLLDYVENLIANAQFTINDGTCPPYEIVVELRDILKEQLK